VAGLQQVHQAWVDAYGAVTKLMLEGANYPSGIFNLQDKIQPKATGIKPMNEITLVPNNSLITATPEEGRQLAVKMSRLIIKMTQPDEEKRKQLRDVYGNDAGMLIAIGQSVATEFATIAAANNYWKK
jgi:hypothetical protein